MRTFLFLMKGVEPFTFYATDRKAATAYGLEKLGYTPGMQHPRCTAVAIA